MKVTVYTKCGLCSIYVSVRSLGIEVPTLGRALERVEGGDVGGVGVGVAVPVARTCLVQGNVRMKR